MQQALATFRQLHAVAPGHTETMVLVSLCLADMVVQEAIADTISGAKLALCAAAWDPKRAAEGPARIPGMAGACCPKLPQRRQAAGGPGQTARATGLCCQSSAVRPCLRCMLPRAVAAQACGQATHNLATPTSPMLEFRTPPRLAGASRLRWLWTGPVQRRWGGWLSITRARGCAMVHAQWHAQGAPGLRASLVQATQEALQLYEQAGRVEPEEVTWPLAAMHCMRAQGGLPQVGGALLMLPGACSRLAGLMPFGAGHGHRAHPGHPAPRLHPWVGAAG